MKPTIRVVLLASCVVLADQVTKALVRRDLGGLSSNGEKKLAGNWLSLHYVRNDGAASGLLAGRGTVASVLAIIAIAVLIACFFSVRNSTPSVIIGAGLVLGGAAGNLTDRFRFGHVTDFIAVGRWPKFNLADSAVTLGVICLVCHFLFQETAKREGPRREPDTLSLRHIETAEDRS